MTAQEIYEQTRAEAEQVWPSTSGKPPSIWLQLARAEYQIELLLRHIEAIRASDNVLSRMASAGSRYLVDTPLTVKELVECADKYMTGGRAALVGRYIRVMYKNDHDGGTWLGHGNLPPAEAEQVIWIINRADTSNVPIEVSRPTFNDKYGLRGSRRVILLEEDYA